MAVIEEYGDKYKMGDGNPLIETLVAAAISTIDKTGVGAKKGGEMANDGMLTLPQNR